MRQGNILDGIRAGFQSYMQTRQWGSQMQSNKLQQEQMTLANRMREQQMQDYMSPQDRAAFERSEAMKGLEEKYAWGREKGLPEFMTPEEKLQAEMDRIRAYGKEGYAAPGVVPLSRYDQTNRVTPAVSRGLHKDAADVINSFYPDISPYDVPIFNTIHNEKQLEMQGLLPVGYSDMHTRVWAALHPTTTQDNKSVLAQSPFDLLPGGYKFYPMDANGNYEMVENPKTGELEPMGYDPYHYLIMSAGNKPTEQVLAAAQVIVQDAANRGFLPGGYGEQAGPPSNPRLDEVRALADRLGVAEEEATKKIVQTKESWGQSWNRPKRW